jgi:hypothetical protein
MPSRRWSATVHGAAAGSLQAAFAAAAPGILAATIRFRSAEKKKWIPNG